MRSLPAILVFISFVGCFPYYKFVDKKTKIIPNYLINTDSLLVYKPFVPWMPRRIRFDTIEARILDGLQVRLGLSREVQALKTTCFVCQGSYTEDNIGMEPEIHPEVKEFRIEASCLDSCLFVPPNKHGLFLVIDPEQIEPENSGSHSTQYDVIAVRMYILRGDQIVYYRHYRSVIESKGKLEGIYKQYNYLGRLPVWPDHQIELVLQAMVEDLRQRLY